MIEKAGDRIARVLELALAVAFLAAICLNFANVIGRYLVGVSIIGADEVQVFILVWMAFLGAAVVAWRHQHLRMDVLAQRFPSFVRHILKITELIVILALCVFIFVQSWRYTWQVFTFEQTSDLAEIPMWIPHGAIVVGFALMAIIAVWHLIGVARKLSQLGEPLSGK